MDILPTVRHYIGDTPGYGACGIQTGFAQGGETATHDHPATEWEQEHITTVSVSLYKSLRLNGPETVCRPCVLLATEQLMKTAPDMVPDWAQTEKTLLARLEGSYPPEPDLNWPDQEAPF